MKRSRWNVWQWGILIVGVLGTVMAIALAVVVLRMVFPQSEHASCTRTLGASCTDLSPQAIGELADMTLPPGTVIESSRYEAFQDEFMEAVVVIPRERISAWEASLTSYPEPTTVGCKGLEDRGTDRRCSQTQVESQGLSRSYTRVVAPDGSLVVSVRMLDM